MFDEQNLIDTFQTEHEQQTAMERIKSLDTWLRGLISVCAFVAASYTAMHGINATLQFRAHGTLGTITGIAGVIVLEILFLVLSHGLIHGTFKGSKRHLSFMWVAAGLALAFILLNTVIDSQLNAANEMIAQQQTATAAALEAAETEAEIAAIQANAQQAQNAVALLSRNLAFYLQYIMPVASVVVVVLALVGLYFAPESERERKRGKQVYDYDETVFASYIAGKRAELATAKIIGNAQLNAKMNAAKLTAGAFNSEQVQAAIQQSALGSVPALLRAIGVNPEQIPDANANGTLDLDDIAAYLETNPALAARLFAGARRWNEAQRGVVRPRGNGRYEVEFTEGEGSPEEAQEVVDNFVNFRNGQENGR